MRYVIFDENYITSDVSYRLLMFYARVQTISYIAIRALKPILDTCKKNKLTLKFNNIEFLYTIKINEILS